MSKCEIDNCLTPFDDVRPILVLETTPRHLGVAYICKNHRKTEGKE